MQQGWRTILILSGGVLVAVLIMSHGYLEQQLRLILANVPATSQGAATPLGVEQGLPSYSGYPSPTTCNTGDSLCYPNTRIGVFSIRNQGSQSSTGLTNYINRLNTTGSVGVPVVLQSISPTTVEWSCQPSQAVSTFHSQTCYQQCGCWSDNYGGVFCNQCPYECGSWSTTNYTFANSISIKDPKGNTIINSGSLFGTQSVELAGTAGTYDSGQTINYSLTCNGSGTNPPPPVPVTMGSTVTQTSLSANPTTVRAGLDTSTLTITASSAVAGSCKLLAPDGSTVKSYSGTSVNDTVQVGPFGNQVTPQTYQIVCLGPEGFNSRKSVSLTVKFPPNLSITANNTPYSILIPPASSADIRWTSSNQLPNSCSVSYAVTGGSCIAAAKSVATQGAYNWKSFTIGADTYLAVANAYDGVSYNVNSSIYKWIPSLSCFGKDGSSVCGTAYQSIATNGAAKWESFTIGADPYLAVANSRNDSTRNVNSNIYKWTTASGCPASGGLGDGTTCGSVYQAIATNGAVDIKPVIVGADTYLAVANYRDDSSYTINSNIYKWMSYSPSNNCPHVGNSGGGFGDGTACGSVLQTIPTKGAYRMESFVLENASYLAVTNAFDPTLGVGYNQPSYIYKYIASGYNCPAGGGFGNAEYGSCGTPFQAINTSGAYGWKFFTVGNVSYLAVANAYNEASFNINSKIYKWMTGAQCFGSGTACGSAFQTIATNGATQLQTFTTGPDLYLIAANAYNGSSYNINSSFYQWMPGSQCFGDGTACGTAFQSVPTSGAAWFEPVTISGNIYLATANYFNGTTRNINSSIMQWSPSGCGDTELGTPTVWTADNTTYAINGVHFDGTNDYLTRGAGLTGAVDGKKGIFSAWFKFDAATDASSVRMFTSVTTNIAVEVAKISGGAIRLVLRNSAESTILSINSSQTYDSSDGWIHVLASWDLGNSYAEMYINDVSDDGTPTIVDGTVDYTNSNWVIGAHRDLSGKTNGDMADFYFNTVTNLDLSVESNRRKFISAQGRAVSLGSDGSTPTGTAPIIFLSGATAGWETNDGSGGGFTENGALSDASADPDDDYQTGVFTGSRLYTLGCKWLDGTTASSTSVKVTTQAELMLSANGSTTPTVYITPDTSALVQWSTKSIQQNSCTVTSANAYGWPTDNTAADNNPTGYSSPVLADGQSVAYTLACIDLAGDNASKEMTVAAATQLPSAASDMSISVKRVVRGGRPTLTWNAINLNPGISCSVTPALQNGVPTWDGTSTSWSSPLGGALGPIINTTTTFTLACVNKAGNSASVSATAYLVPAFKEL